MPAGMIATACRNSDVEVFPCDTFRTSQRVAPETESPLFIFPRRPLTLVGICPTVSRYLLCLATKADQRSGVGRLSGFWPRWAKTRHATHAPRLPCRCTIDGHTPKCTAQYIFSFSSYFFVIVHFANFSHLAF